TPSPTTLPEVRVGPGPFGRESTRTWRLVPTGLPTIAPTRVAHPMARLLQNQRLRVSPQPLRSSCAQRARSPGGRALIAGDQACERARRRRARSGAAPRPSRASEHGSGTTFAGTPTEPTLAIGL